MHPLQSRASIFTVPNSSTETIAFLEYSLQILKPLTCREVWTAIWRWSLHIANQIRLRDGHLTSREVSYPSYTVARRHLDPRVHHNITLYHANPLLVHHTAATPIDWCFIDCDAKEYEVIFISLLPYLDWQSVVIFDDMHTASSKCPQLQSTLQNYNRNFFLHASEADDEILVASPHHNTLTLLHHQKA